MRCESMLQRLTLDNPKSAILRSSRFSPQRMFSGLRSLWTIPRSCKYATDSSSGRINFAASNSVNLSDEGGGTMDYIVIVG